MQDAAWAFCCFQLTFEMFSLPDISSIDLRGIRLTILLSGSEKERRGNSVPFLREKMKKSGTADLDPSADRKNHIVISKKNRKVECLWKISEPRAGKEKRCTASKPL